MKFCLGSRCRTQDGSFDSRRRVAAFVPLIAVLPSTILLLTRHHHDPQDTSSTGLGVLAGIAVGIVFGLVILALKCAMTRKR